MAHPGKQLAMAALLAATQLLPSVTARAARISVMGDCVAVPDPRCMLEACRRGQGLTYMTSDGGVTLSIVGAATNASSWRIDVRRESARWPSGVRLWVRRSGAGMGSGRIRGGETFQEVTPTSTFLCSGSGDRLNVPLQIKVTGLSFQTPVGTYTAALAYTLITLGE